MNSKTDLITICSSQEDGVFLIKPIPENDGPQAVKDMLTVIELLLNLEEKMRRPGFKLSEVQETVDELKALNRRSLAPYRVDTITI